MRLRRSSIRARIVALLLVPLAALSGLWVYATLVTTGDVWKQLDLSSTYTAFGDPADEYAYDLQQERAAAVLRLASPGNADYAAAYAKARTATDRDLQLLRYQGNSKDAGKLDADQRARFQDVLAVADQLGAIRSQIGQQRQSWDGALRDYSDVITPVFAFRSSFIAKQSGSLPRQGTILVELSRAGEYLSQETAAMRALRAGSEAAAQDPRKQQVALDAMNAQQALFRIYIGELGAADRQSYNTLRLGQNWSALTAAENGFDKAADRALEVRGGAVDAWGETADKVLADIDAINSRLAGDIGDQARDNAISALVRGGTAGLIGLAAVILSVVISYRTGRRLVRELVGLRNAAADLSATRLPSVMLRLRRGDAVDVVAEVPQLEFGTGEIGQVGRAFNEVQRVAVEAAVEQAELRRGVSAVFVNLARRSQVLLHRQLTLLDTMERRTEDPRELEDLFRLDHLTTRMRRHAEGLIILSGGSPGRAWRKPVRMVDVVRAAVGEVEDYARVHVRPFPGTGLLGAAVADVTHLVAELVENATVFSPPQTQVTVQGEVVAHGFCLEIDDRGLGLSEQHLAEINQRLAVEQEFDLADTDRLGLFVVSRLARRHGIRVHLRPSPYGGTSAVVLIPRELLAETVETAPDAPRTTGEDTGTHRRPPAPAGPGRGAHAAPATAALGGPRPSAAEPAGTPGGLPRRRNAGAAPAAEPDTAGTGRHRRPEDDAGRPALPPGPSAAVSAAAPAAGPALTPVAGGLLPKRVRQASLAPQLRPGADTDAAAAAAEPARERDPEEARSAFASFQRGFARGRGDRLQPASLTVVRSEPDPDDTARPAERPSPLRPLLPGQPPRLRVALPSAPVPHALPAAPVRSVPPAHRPPTAPPAPAEGTES
ncbi:MULTISPECIES: nitrate- and nitrite sensing domain-containing protein [Kitasatospora]|uniref:histidine kinase n=1 Tax=Kitasatospora setae (strain ATCC 33774 / DSM 43861 / JCM 3304 / KCC A-0304 / NBRC 14216 / KM-6054) TaxID=452652 RepID=E4N1K9_KITSK|nr:MULTISPECIES: nitrate- and nitrite sensing domain-containing protein [Kitasatospora]BAJ32043.1 putative histidine kinase [Kitasatospora setae KM-6054]